MANCDWSDVACRLDERGYARLPGLLEARECTVLVESFADDSLFRSFIDMERFRFGKGDYRYFDYPLPPIVRALRKHLYPPLATIANRWQEQLGEKHRYPPGLDTFLAQCHGAGQTRPTPLLLHYDQDGYNCLHQDRYGDVAFPLQVVIALSRPGIDFEGGELATRTRRTRSLSRDDAPRLEPTARGETLCAGNHLPRRRVSERCASPVPSSQGLHHG